ncbi:MAG: hypothetical protein R8F63_10850 [Acidimicrobiales bacterium]|nr:hypothetical protein [Acidimicrobiales bacterium]
MPIFRSDGSQLAPLRQLTPGPELYESEIEDLLWSNLEAFTGGDLFPVCRQGRISTGGRPDVLALDQTGRVVIFEVKRSLDRSQLAQSLEYAGWARTASLDELAALYFADDPGAFFADWQEFTGTSAPQVISQEPLLYLVAGEVDDRTHGAIAFLEANGLPVEIVTVTVYEDGDGSRLFRIDGKFDDITTDSATPETPGRATPVRYTHNGRRLHINDLAEAGLLAEGDELRWVRPRSGDTFHAEIAADGQIRLPDGRLVDSPSQAAMSASGLAAVAGWDVWQVPARGDKWLCDLREEFLALQAVEPVDGTTP